MKDVYSIDFIGVFGSGGEGRIMGLQLICMEHKMKKG